MNKLMFGILTGVGLAACATEPATQSYEELRDDVRRSFDGEEFFLISGDVGVTETELRAIYDQVVGDGDGLSTTEQQSIVNRVGSRDDKWSAAAALDLRYCVSNSFGSRKTRMVNEMAQATAAWEGVARVNFTYVPAQDASCTGSNPNVRFAVRPWTSGGACAFFPSGGGCVARTVVIDIVDLDTNYGDIAPNVRTVGVLRHELGHVLGLRHEHTRPNSGTCFENNAWRALTPYDRNSVMHYPWCNGNTLSSLAITSSDATGARTLYGAP